MKHSMSITLMIILTFIVSQFIGVLIINSYISVNQGSDNVTWEQLPYDIDRPVEESSYSFIPIFIAILIGTVLLLFIIKFRKPIVWKGWFFLSVSLSLLIAFYPFIKKLLSIIPLSYLPEIITLIIAAVLAYFKIFKPNVYVHNITELFIYGGIAALFVPVLNFFSITVLLVLIAFYDMYAVWKSKHMVTLAKFQTSSKTFAGIMFNKKDTDSTKFTNVKSKVSTKTVSKTSKKVSKSGGFAILGGGDIAFPLLFTGVVLKKLLFLFPVYQAILFSLILIGVNALALFLLLYYAKKEKFYPAMPFLSASSFIGYGLLYLLIL